MLRKEDAPPRVRRSEVGGEVHRGHEGQQEQSVNRNNHCWEGSVGVLKIFLYLIFPYFFHVCLSCFILFYFIL